MFARDEFPEGTWQYQEAKAKLSQVMDETQRTGMQVIVRNRKEVFIVLTQEKYEEYVKPMDSLAEFFMRAPYPDVELDTSRTKDFPRELDL